MGARAHAERNRIGQGARLPEHRDGGGTTTAQSGAHLGQGTQ